MHANTGEEMDNDLHLSTDENKLFMYVDDHQLFSAVETTNEAESSLTEEGNNISECCKQSFTRNSIRY